MIDALNGSDWEAPVHAGRSRSGVFEHEAAVFFCHGRCVLSSVGHAASEGTLRLHPDAITSSLTPTWVVALRRRLPGKVEQQTTDIQWQQAQRSG